MTEERALRIDRRSESTIAEIQNWSAPMPARGEVRLRARWSSLNYKDALAVTGKGRILRRFPLNAGVDVSGVIEQSEDPRFQVGDDVLVTGRGLSETRDGGLATTVTVPADSVVHLPSGLSLRQAMEYGTAGFAAGLAISRLLDNGQAPELGAVAVTGATGGVGSFAIAILSRLGYTVHAISRKFDAEDYLKALGATEVIALDALRVGTRPLETERYGGVVDNVGGDLLSRLIRVTAAEGNVASIGMAGGVELNTTVLPFILRGVTLIGVRSAGCPMPRRRDVWTHLAGDWKPVTMDSIPMREITLDEVPGACDEILAGGHIGRFVVRLAD
ncbi:YhdH/YhfP family quinone oxidoreductase [uncultured Abyssibacter sp.]|uniref:YhdH/YhfP family quinone oxidoreductase n=1 Tax=uncultured Abyssibacter sp. TaxID=2320202 RepID=UPI0032B20463